MKKVMLRTAALCMALCLLLAGYSSADTGNAGGQTESQTAASAQENSNSSQQREGEEAMSEYTYAVKETWVQNGDHRIYGVAYVPNADGKMPLVIFSHELGNDHSGFWEDSTRLPEYYDGTYRYLKSLGLEEI